MLLEPEKLEPQPLTVETCEMAASILRCKGYEVCSRPENGAFRLSFTSNSKLGGTELSFIKAPDMGEGKLKPEVVAFTKNGSCGPFRFSEKDYPSLKVAIEEVLEEVFEDDQEED